MLQYSAWHKKEEFCTTKVNFVAVIIHFDEAVLYVENGHKSILLYEATHFSFSSETPGFKRKSSLSFIIFSSHLPAKRH